MGALSAVCTLVNVMMQKIKTITKIVLYNLLSCLILHQQKTKLSLVVDSVQHLLGHLHPPLHVKAAEG